MGNMRRLSDRVRSTLRRVGVHVLNTASNIAGDDVMSRRFRSLILRFAGANAPPSTSFHGGTHFTNPGNLNMGERCFINRNCYLDLEAPLTIGDDVVIGHGTTIVTTSHAIGPSSRRAGEAVGMPVVLQSGVWLGAGVIVLAGVTIGAGAIVAAGAVVIADVPGDVVVGGSPARVIRKIEDDPE